MPSRSTDDIEKELIEEVAMILSRDVKDVSRDEPLHNMGLDSLGFVELLVSIEKNFNVKLIDSSLSQEDFSTIYSLSQRLFEATNES